MPTKDNKKTLLVIGAGPGIGRAVTTLFAARRYDNVALVARRPDQLELEKAALLKAVEGKKPLKVKTFAVDVTDTDALARALDDADAALGPPECVFWNAARVLPSALLAHHVKEIEYDFRVCT